DVALLFKPLLERKAQRLRVRVRPLLPVVIGDQQRLSMVLANLLSNASKYADPDTTIGVAVAPRAGAVRVTVADRGPGVRPENTDQLFQAYNRAGRTDSDGLGIGLSVVRSIIEAHGGKVGYASRSGGGAVFWFELMAAGAATSSVGANVRESVG
ncbi:MAG TPA: ATP-binding protein, partial [Candidatus Limnocylindria bacterium]